MFEKTDKVDKLAKALKESSMAETMDDAVKMAEEMVETGEESIAELSRQPPSAEELIEKKKLKLGAKKRIKHALHIGEKEKEPESVKEEAEKLIEEIEKEERKERLDEIKKEASEIKSHVKRLEEGGNSKRIEDLRKEIEELKEDVEEVEKE